MAYSQASSEIIIDRLFVIEATQEVSRRAPDVEAMPIIDPCQFYELTNLPKQGQLAPKVFMSGASLGISIDDCKMSNRPLRVFNGNRWVQLEADTDFVCN